MNTSTDDYVIPCRSHSLNVSACLVWAFVAAFWVGLAWWWLR